MLKMRIETDLWCRKISRRLLWEEYVLLTQKQWTFCIQVMLQDRLKERWRDRCLKPWMLQLITQHLLACLHREALILSNLWITFHLDQTIRMIFLIMNKSKHHLIHSFHLCLTKMSIRELIPRTLCGGLPQLWVFTPSNLLCLHSLMFSQLLLRNSNLPSNSKPPSFLQPSNPSLQTQSKSSRITQPLNLSLVSKKTPLIVLWTRTLLLSTMPPPSLTLFTMATMLTMKV